MKWRDNEGLVNENAIQVKIRTVNGQYAGIISTEPNMVVEILEETELFPDIPEDTSDENYEDACDTGACSESYFDGLKSDYYIIKVIGEEEI